MTIGGSSMTTVSKLAHRFTSAERGFHVQAFSAYVFRLCGYVVINTTKKVQLYTCETQQNQYIWDNKVTA